MNLVNPHIETTAGKWPNSQQLKDHLSIPLTLSMEPFGHSQLPGSIKPEEVNEYRCQSCKAFINQLCFIRSDHEYDCSLCGCTNALKSPIDYSMPELNSLSYKIKAPTSQRLLSTPQRLVAFLLDLSNYGPEAKEYLLNALHVVKEFIRVAHQRRENIKVMVMGFDSGVIRYALTGKERKLKKILGDTDEDEDGDYLPQSQALIASPSHDSEQLTLILEDIEESIMQDRLRSGHSKAIMRALEVVFQASQQYSGKIFLVSGLRAELAHFYNNLKRYFSDVHQRHSFLVNKKENISAAMDKLLQTTQMSLWAGFVNNQYMNNMPFHCITKQLNGELRHYFPAQLTLFFHDFKEKVEEMLDENTAYEGLMRVRYSTGLKMVGVFGAFRGTKTQDQVELLTCPSNRRYMFQFILQSKIFTEFVVMQFSTLYTSLSGERFFTIQTHMNKVTSDLSAIIQSIDYANINISYVRGIVHNLDMSFKLRNLQLILQERCKKHIKAVREIMQGEVNMDGKGVIENKWIDKAKPYIVLSFLMMKHFLLNQIYPNQINFDLNAEMRSKVATMEDFVNIIWPIVYAVGEDSWEIIEMKEKNISKATKAIFIDRCDQHYVYLADSHLLGQLRTANGKQRLEQLIASEASLEPLRELIEEYKERRGLRYLDLTPLEEIGELKILDMEGQFGFDSFINELVRQ